MAIDDLIDLDGLPLILCGPILRRVESHLVSVFVALKEPCLIELVIRESPDLSSATLYSHAALGAETQPTIPLGKHLHVATVALKIESATATLQGLLPGTLYGYDLALRPVGGGAPQTLAGLLNGDYPLGFVPGRLPGFVLPPLELGAANLFHGSCRKPHGEGNDMLAVLDDLIGPDPADLARRPHLLLLTGDQIYADDVALPLLRTLNATARQLLGWRERFAGTGMSTPALDEGLADTRAACDALGTLLATLQPAATSPVVLDSGTFTALSAGLNELPGLIARVRESLPNLPIADLRQLPQIVMLSMVRGQLDSYREEIEAQRDDLPAAAAPASIEAAALTRISFLVDGLRAFLDNLGGLVSDLVSDSAWGRVDDNPAPADDGVSLAMRLMAGWNYRLSRIAPPQRAAEMRQHAQLSSDAMDGHLLFLGEFYMMYLFAWSDVLWRRTAGGPIGARLASFKEAVPNYGVVGAYRQRAIDAQRTALLAFAETLPKVRRVLANVPTLMIFDDHEVTDDWNLNHDWVALVNQSLAGPQLLRNALAAYAVFQDWGNQPEDYQPNTRGHEILQAIRMQTDASGTLAPPTIIDPVSGGAAPLLDDVLGIGAFALSPAPGRHKRWSYRYNPHPQDATRPFQVVVLDTRTRRAFPDQGMVDELVSDLKLLLRDVSAPDASIGRVAPAALISDAALAEQLGGTVLGDDMTHIVVSPAPVFGVPLLEDALQRISVAKDNPEMHDNEAWQSNPAALTRLIETLAGKDVVLLSGDVHYAFSNDILLTEHGGRVVQLCASSLKNETDGTRALGLLGHLGTFQELFAVFTPEQLGVLLALFEDNAREHLAEAQTFGGTAFWGSSLLPTEGDAGGASDVWFAETAGMFDPMVHYLRLKDVSLFTVPHLIPTGLRVAGASISGFGDLFTAAQGDGVFAREQFTVRFLRDDGIIDSPDIVGYNNIGQIRFDAAAGGRLSHTLYWHIHEQAQITRQLLMTIHETQPRWWYLKRALARLAQVELARWRDVGGGLIRETLPGGGRDPRAVALLNLYYRSAGLSQPVWHPEDEVIWSAAFISYLVTRAGGAALFRRSAAHIDYIREALESRQAERDTPFWLYEVGEYAPEIGDIVCRDRADAGELAVTYANLMAHDPAVPDGFRKTHCDIVVHVARNEGRLTTIGGNLDDTVGETQVALDGEGKLAEAGYFAVLRVGADEPAGGPP